MTSGASVARFTWHAPCRRPELPRAEPFGLRTAARECIQFVLHRQCNGTCHAQPTSPDKYDPANSEVLSLAPSIRKLASPSSTPFVRQFPLPSRDPNIGLCFYLVKSAGLSCVVDSGTQIHAPRGHAEPRGQCRLMPLSV